MDIRLASEGNGDVRSPQFLVEFVRGNIDIFTFQKFFNWMRTRLKAIVKSDYSCNLLEHNGDIVPVPIKSAM